ncbi:uncharacterized protein LOC143208803 isoform X2 [Lasioglossum baleicum]|uniref:uncharacterized protein LOC143208803 isoform X2 n=1 Tax=Lasioglossum baleicum TaxID=434251 RepID=UPI003FCD5E53
MENKDLANKLETLQQMHSVLQQYYTLLQFMRVELEKIMNNFITLKEQNNIYRPEQQESTRMNKNSSSTEHINYFKKIYPCTRCTAPCLVRK